VIQLDLQDYGNVLNLYATPYLALPIEGMAAGNSPGEIWVDDPARPQTGVAWDGSHSLYFAGNPENAVAIKGLERLIQDNILPSATSRKLELFKLYYANTGWETRLKQLFNFSTLVRRGRLFFRWNGPIRLDESQSGIALQRINSELLASCHLANLDLLSAEIQSCWPSLAQFLRNGFGFCVLVDTTGIASWCTAEYVTGRQCGIGIETVETFQNRGYGSLAARAFVAHCQEHAISPHWDCWDDNHPSIRVAQNVGFGDPIAYSVFVCLLVSAR
jgi:RimJ/RimL family protein N-acetyltransferase